MPNRAKLFISYRRKDWAFTHRLVEDLDRQLNADIFIDLTGIDRADFEKSILNHLRDASGVLLVVSPLTFDPNRIEREDDWVRREIALALRLNKPMLLACIDGLKPPASPALPQEIRDVTRIQGIDFYPDYWGAGIQRLTDFITRIIPSITLKSPDEALPARRTKPILPVVPVENASPIKGRAHRRFITISVVLFALLIAVVGGALLSSLNPGSTVPTQRVVAIATTVIPPTTEAPVPTKTLLPKTLVPTVTNDKQWEPVIQTKNGAQMVLVPPGCFKMGSNSNLDKSAEDNETPQFQMCFSLPFWIDEFDVTNADYQKFIDDGGYKQQGTWWTQAGWNWYQGDKNNAHPVNYSSFTDPNQPRVGITWFEATAFCQWRGARLPTEAEWEYAARGPSDPIYPWGFQSQDIFDPSRVVSSAAAVIGRSAPVGTKPGGISWVGALDMIGNVWQWTDSIYVKTAYGPTYKSADYENALDADSLRVLRGGAWFDTNVAYLRAAYRNRYYPNSQSTDDGVRCARSF